MDDDRKRNSLNDNASESSVSVSRGSIDKRSICSPAIKEVSKGSLFCLSVEIEDNSVTSEEYLSTK